ncbi:hypothetical protein [Nocardioides daejeonensis]|uniref:hypothetical protein n=1 Tax=Nocardioides daejeonensis TaxID=1046556 RepID=UPI000D740B6F|nr:hypothetical protein [Nocardioides daejeonensis]
MSTKDHDTFPPSNGRFAGWFGVGLAVVALIGVLGNGWQRNDLVLVPLLVLFAFVVWSAVLQPHAAVRDGRLELHHSFHTTRVPLASIRDVEVRMAMLVRLAEGGRLTFAPIARTRREIMKAKAADPLSNYADLVEERLRHLSAEARELGAAAGPVTRQPAPVRIAALIALVAVVATALLVA